MNFRCLNTIILMRDVRYLMSSSPSAPSPPLSAETLVRGAKNDSTTGGEAEPHTEVSL